MGKGSLTRRAAEIEIQWRQSPGSGWVALLIERGTDRRWEVRSEAELAGVLRSIVGDGRRRMPAAPRRRRTALTGLLGGETETGPARSAEPGRDGSGRLDG